MMLPFGMGMLGEGATGITPVTCCSTITITTTQKKKLVCYLGKTGSAVLHNILAHASTNFPISTLS